MRIISFSKKWDKLNQPIFTTFRYPRIDKDWYAGELVQVFYKSRSPQRELLGIAKIIEKDKRDLDYFFENTYTIVTDEEAILDGFVDLKDMTRYMEKQYGLDYISLFNKLTLEWVV